MEAITEIKTLKVPAAEVKVGDLAVVQGHWWTVASVDAKVKWVTIQLEGAAKRRRHERDELVEVQRKVETEESADARRYEFMLNSLWTKAQNAFADQQKAINKLQEFNDKGYRIGHFEIAHVAEATIPVDFWSSILRHVGHEFGDTGEVMDLGLAYLIACEGAINDLVEDRYRGGSTSPWSNGLNAAGREFLAKEVRYGYHRTDVLAKRWAHLKREPEYGVLAGLW